MKSIALGGREISYIQKKARRKSISAFVNKEGVIEVRTPYGISDGFVRDFLELKAERIIVILENYSRRMEYEDALGDEGLDKLMEKAHDLIPDRVRYYSEIMGVRPTRVKIGKAKKRFGSCSSSGNLNFSCRVMAYSAKAVDYVVVHELSHLIHMNHSREFWRTVEKYMPDYKLVRDELKHLPE